MIIKIVFWASLLFTFYAYIGYPLLLLVISVFRKHPVKKGKIRPTVSFIIAAYNEEKKIQEKIENILRQNYPKDKLEIIIASDCSADSTDDIVKSYASSGIQHVRSPERKGKENAQKLAVDVATGEILVFSDVATILRQDGISNIVKNFHDPSVGCVSSVDKFIDTDGTMSGEGMYVKYEMFLRKLESRINTLIGLSGSFFAARKEVCHPWAIDVQSDFNTLLNACRMGLKGVSDPDSIGYYVNIIDERKEFDRKVRTVLRGIFVLMKNLDILNPFQYGLLSWQLLSHKLCRWFVPFAIILLFFSNALLLSQSVLYLWPFLFQVLFYAVALVGIGARLLTTKDIFKIPAFFLIVNLSILSAWLQYFQGKQIVTWNPSER